MTIPEVEIHKAVDGVCAWPNLTLLPDGRIAAVLHNQPTHAKCESDLDCWGSSDGGSTWEFWGRPGPHEPGVCRGLNCAAGLAHNGDLLALVAGLSGRFPFGTRRPDFANEKLLPPQISRSADGGQSWSITSLLQEPDGAPTAYVPFGDVQVADDGALCASFFYLWGVYPNEDCEAYLLRSYDDGYTWDEPALIGKGINETAVLSLGDGKWLAAGRATGQDYLVQYASQDDGRTWELSMPLSLPLQVNGHLLKLADGRVLLNLGNRCINNGGVDARVSEDDGKTWSAPFRLVHLPNFPGGYNRRGDGGYPSSVQRADGKIITAYYQRNEGEFDYEMNIAIWNPSDF